MLFFAFVLGRDVPVLGLVDLGFHELGHLVTAPFGRTFSFFMGSGMQILVPAGLAGYFGLLRHDEMAAGLMVVWMGTSMQDVSVYVGDAPFQLLPLIGGEHDWAYLLGHWGVMNRAEDLAGMVWTLGLLAAIAGLAWIVYEGWIKRRGPASRPARDISTLPVREPRHSSPPAGGSPSSIEDGLKGQGSVIDN